jgi:diguanylate cyclase (GGDEF)-like protein
MGVSTQMKKAIFLTWIIVVPAGMWFTYKMFPPDFTGMWVDFLAFILLTAIVASMPIVINDISIFLIQWVSIAAFLKFGLFAEMILGQLAVLVLLLKIRVRKEDLFRFPLNLNMFFLVSLLSGLVYYALGGRTGQNLNPETSLFWLIIIYGVVSYTLNQVILSLHLYYIYKERESYFDKGFLVETVTTLITLPLGVVLYIVYNLVGLWSILLIGIPFISIALIFNLYYASQKINEYLQHATEIGQQMAESLKVTDIIDLFIQKISEMLPVDVAYIYEVVSEKELELVRCIHYDGELKSRNSIQKIRKNEGISGYTWTKQKASLFSSTKEWKSISRGEIPIELESILTVPIVRNKEVVGVLLLASKRKRAYEKSQLMIVEILCSFFAVAIENAKNYEKTRLDSERCALTSIYNYRYFENLLNEEFAKLSSFERRELALIILDIDHFKSVNDTYGHQSGNEVLIELATRLRDKVGPYGTVARYGGEEFVILLPEVEKKAAYQFAEQIRQTIANEPFTLEQSMINGTKQQVYITASIGVASAPEDAEGGLALIRHADRALYVGAKQAGRNRVAEYVK